jgi:hypothetical protein
MLRLLTIAALALAVIATPAQAARMSGHYVEVRNCDVWTGPCFANAESNLSGKNAAMVWNIEEGTFDDVQLDGLTVVAVVQSSDTLGLKQSGPAKAVILVDSRATKAQQEALVKFAKAQGGDLLKNVVDVQAASMKVFICGCKGEACAVIEAGPVKIKTRCLDAKHDKACGNEIAYYPPLTTRGVHAIPAVAEHAFSGTGLAENWYEAERRGAYVGTFSLR